jgi:hypothetical protein
MRPNLCLFFGVRELFPGYFQYRAFDRWDHGFAGGCIFGSFLCP